MGIAAPCGAGDTVLDTGTRVRLALFITGTTTLVLEYVNLFQGVRGREKLTPPCGAGDTVSETVTRDRGALFITGTTHPVLEHVSSTRVRIII